MSENLFFLADIHDSQERVILNSFSKNIRFGIYFYERLIKQPREFNLSDIVVLSLYRKLLELSDGLFILVDHNSSGASNLTARSIIEVYLSLSYIIEDEDLMEKRALCYFLFHKEEELKILNTQHSFNLLKQKYSESTLDQMKNSINNLKKKDPFKHIINDKKKLIRTEQHGRKRYVKWYSIYNKSGIDIFSISELIKYIADTTKETVKDLYAILSLEVHGASAIKHVKTNSNHIVIDTIRSQDDKNEGIINAIRSYISKSSIKLITVYSSELIDEFHEFFMKDRGY